MSIAQPFTVFTDRAASISSDGEFAPIHFKHQFTVRLPHHAEPVEACADLRCHLGVPVVDRVTIFPRGTMFVTLEPRTDAFRRALREIRGPEAGAIRKRAFELATVDAELVEVATFGARL